MKRAALAALVVAGLAAVVGQSSASTSARWVMTDVAALFRLEFPQFGPVALVGMTPSGRVVWTAQTPTGGQEDREVFQWQNGVITDLGTLPRHTLPYALNAGGAMVGGSEDPPYCPPYGPPPRCRSGPSHAYLWQPGKTTWLPTLGGASSGAAAVNDRGQIVGASDTASGKRHAVLWQGGKVADIGIPSSIESYAWAINNRGQVLLDVQTQTTDAAVLWQHGTTTPIVSNCEARALNDRGQVVGDCWNGKVDRAFLWQDGKTTDLGVTSGYPMTIDDRGDVIESEQTSNSSTRGILWRNGKKIDLGGLGGKYTVPIAINARGQVVGMSAFPGMPDGFLNLHPFIWQNGKLQGLPADGSVLQLDAVMDINAAGTLIAGGTKPFTCDLNSCAGQLLVWQYR